jgi:hypothetical protein
MNRSDGAGGGGQARAGTSEQGCFCSQPGATGSVTLGHSIPEKERRSDRSPRIPDLRSKLGSSDETAIRLELEAQIDDRYALELKSECIATLHQVVSSLTSNDAQQLQGRYSHASQP